MYFVSPEEFAARAFPDANVKELGITINGTPTASHVVFWL